MLGRQAPGKYGSREHGFEHVSDEYEFVHVSDAYGIEHVSYEYGPGECLKLIWTRPLRCLTDTCQTYVGLKYIRAKPVRV